jgi:hypothetical protein
MITHLKAKNENYPANAKQLPSELCEAQNKYKRKQNHYKNNLRNQKKLTKNKNITK